MWDSWYTNSVFCQVRYRNQCPLLCLAESRCLGYRMSNAPGVGATVCEYILDYWLQFALILDTQKRVCAHHLAMIGNEFSNHKMQYHIFLTVWFKRLITVWKELRQQHPSDLLSGAGTSRERSLIITWLNNVVSNAFTTEYVQNHHQIERRRLLASIVASGILP